MPLKQGYLVLKPMTCPFFGQGEEQGTEMMDDLQCLFQTFECHHRVLQEMAFLTCTGSVWGHRMSQ